MRSCGCRLFLGGNEYGPDRRAPSDFYLITQGDPAIQEDSASKAAHRVGQAGFDGRLDHDLVALRLKVRNVELLCEQLHMLRTLNMGPMFVPLIGRIADAAGLGRALMVVALLPLIGFAIAMFLPRERSSEVMAAESSI